MSSEQNLPEINELRGPAARPETTVAVTRGVCRLLRSGGWASVLEVPLADGRRADVVGIGPAGELLIVEVKSSLEDFRVDGKWPDYLGWCDRYAFAVPSTFPLEVLPAEVGLIVADAFGGAWIRSDSRPEAATRLVAARRKAVTLRLARLAAERIQRAVDPAFDGAVLE
jgi:hypothetical protein